MERVDGEFVRTYRTGDLVSCDERGEFHIHGRRDNQVKMRGQRIELEEIELALAAYPGLHEAAVLLKSFSDAEDDDRLIAFYVTHKEGGPSAHELRQFVARSLPPYMVPSHFEKRTLLPKSVNGKIDRQQLSLTPLSQADGTVVQMPGTPTEEALLRFWREVPGFEFCGVTDNYFDLGGHSLLASKLFARIRRELGVQLPLSAMFTSPNIRGLARMIDKGVAANAWSPVVTLRTEGHAEPMFLVHALGGNLLSLQPLIRSLPGGHPLYGVQARGLNREGRTHQSIEEMAADYADSIVRAEANGPYILIGYSAGGVVVFEVARRLLTMGKAVRSVVIIDTALNAKGEMFAVEPLRLLITPYFGIRNRLQRSWKKAAFSQQQQTTPSQTLEQWTTTAAASTPEIVNAVAAGAGAMRQRNNFACYCS
jgi:pimeloyl-ACP methyl ester carboxylesterase